MCVIIDANSAAEVFSTPAQPDFKPVIEWILRGDGRMVAGGKNLAELRTVRVAADFISEQHRRGRAILVPQASVDREEKALKAARLCRSNDHHVVALAIVSGAKKLCSADKALQSDFTRAELLRGPKGRVYQRPEHVHLLVHTLGCPATGRSRTPLRKQKHRK